MQRVLRVFALGDVACHGDDPPACFGLHGVSPQLDPCLFAIPARPQHFERSDRAAIGNDCIVNAREIVARHRQHAFRSGRKYLLARKAQHVAGGGIDVDKAHGRAIDQINPVFGGVHGHAEAPQILFALLALGDVLADAAIACKTAVGSENRLAAHLHITPRAIAVGPADLEIAERLPRRDDRLERCKLRFIPDDILCLAPRLAKKRVRLDVRLPGIRLGQAGEAQVFVLFPVPVR